MAQFALPPFDDPIRLWPQTTIRLFLRSMSVPGSFGVGDQEVVDSLSQQRVLQIALMETLASMVSLSIEVASPALRSVSAVPCRSEPATPRVWLVSALLLDVVSRAALARPGSDLAHGPASVTPLKARADCGALKLGTSLAKDVGSEAALAASSSSIARRWASLAFDRVSAANLALKHACLVLGRQNG